MSKFLKPINLVFYLLSVVVFFFIGMYVSGLLGVAKNQGLAGGAIVVFWGLITSFVSLVVSIVLVKRFSHTTVARINWVLFVALIILYGVTHYRYLERQKEKELIEQQEKEEREKRKKEKGVQNKTTSMLIEKQQANTTSLQDVKDSKLSVNTDLGLGMFSPNEFENPTLYFYANINLEKSVDDHTPIDSLVFAKDQYNNTTTTYAPPWLYPEHLKLDYGIMIFKVIGISHDFLKVEVNAITKKTIYLSKYQGSFVPWSAFLLSVSSLELTDSQTQKVHIKPMVQSSEVKVDFTFMQPLLVQDEWMYVKLVDDALKEKGKGWIRWKEKGELLIRYSLFS